MKKLLGLIGAIGLTASAVATGVAMSPVQTIKTETNEISNEKKGQVSTFAKNKNRETAFINVINCRILKNWDVDSRYKWGKRSGYSDLMAGIIATKSREVFEWGEREGGFYVELF